MGIWNGLRSISAKAMNLDSSDIPSDSHRVPPGQAVAEISATVEARKLLDHRDKISWILTGLGKFAVDSAVNDSLKGVTGGIQAYKIVKERLKDRSSLPATNENEKPEHALAMQEMQAKMEKMQEEMGFIKQKNGASVQHAKKFDSSKESSAEAKPPPKADVRKVFIRSRL